MNATALTPELEDYVLDAQIVWITEHVSKDAADHANLGWGVGRDSVVTKVYANTVNAGGYLTSWVEDGAVKHEWES